MKHLAMTITAALMLASVGAGGAGAAPVNTDHKVDRLHQHQGIGGPSTHHNHGPHRH